MQPEILWMTFPNKNYFLALVAIILFVSCNKVPKVHCKDLIYEIPVYISFVGFNVADLDTIVIENYSVGSNFSSLLTKDTIVPYGLMVKNDSSNIILKSKDRALGCNKYSEYKIYPLGLKDTFFIKDIKYIVADEWDTKGECRSREHDVDPYEINLNGAIVTSKYPNHSIYLKK